MKPQTSPTNGVANAEDLLSIGRLSTATGIPIETLRIWERRYGRPMPMRLPSGHRRYSQEDVRWLRRVTEALALGFRPGKVLRAEDQQLTEMLESASPNLPESEHAWLRDAIHGFKAEFVRNKLQGAWNQLGALRFLSEYLEPVIVQIGRLWSEGHIEVRHEHFMAEVLEDFLRSRRLEVERDEGFPVVVLTTLPEEDHGLGLQMAAVVAAMHGASTRMLGTNTPLREMVNAVEDIDADALWLSVSLSSGGVETDAAISQLRRDLAPSIPIVLGGQGAKSVRRSPRGVDVITNFEAIGPWLSELRQKRGS